MLRCSQLCSTQQLQAHLLPASFTCACSCAHLARFAHFAHFAGLLQLLVGFSNDVSRLRARYMSTVPRGGTSHSVLITDIPCVDGLGAKEPSRSGGSAEPSGYKEERLVS
jgi:hypothetical protein